MKREVQDFTDPIYFEAEASEKLGCGRRTMERYRANGTGPAYLRIAGKIAYRRSAVEKWLVELEQQPSRRE